MINFCECFIEEDGTGDLSPFSEERGHVQFDTYMYQLELCRIK